MEPESGFILLEEVAGTCDRATWLKESMGLEIKGRGLDCTFDESKTEKL
jgi:hypothetical protein